MLTLVGIVAGIHLSERKGNEETQAGRAPLPEYNRPPPQESARRPLPGPAAQVDRDPEPEPEPEPNPRVTAKQSTPAPVAPQLEPVAVRAPRPQKPPTPRVHLERRDWDAPYARWTRKKIEAHRKAGRTKVSAAFRGWLRSRQRLVTKCPLCNGVGFVVQMVPIPGGLKRVRKVCPRCRNLRIVAWGGPAKEFLIEHNLLKNTAAWVAQQNATIEVWKGNPNRALPDAIDRRGGSRKNYVIEVSGNHATATADIRKWGQIGFQSCEVKWVCDEDAKRREWLILDDGVDPGFELRTYPERSADEWLGEALRTIGWVFRINWWSWRLTAAPPGPTPPGRARRAAAPHAPSGATRPR